MADRRKAVLQELIADCERDVANMQGQPFTGVNVAKWFGETLVIVQALAKIVDTLVPEDSSPSAVIDVEFEEDPR